jgi:hypothetical protein
MITGLYSFNDVQRHVILQRVKIVRELEEMAIEMELLKEWHRGRMRNVSHEAASGAVWYMNSSRQRVGSGAEGRASASYAVFSISSDSNRFNITQSHRPSSGTSLTTSKPSTSR